MAAVPVLVDQVPTLVPFIRSWMLPAVPVVTHSCTVLHALSGNVAVVVNVVPTTSARTDSPRVALIDTRPTDRRPGPQLQQGQRGAVGFDADRDLCAHPGFAGRGGPCRRTLSSCSAALGCSGPSLLGANRVASLTRPVTEVKPVGKVPNPSVRITFPTPAGDGDTG